MSVKTLLSGQTLLSNINITICKGFLYFHVHVKYIGLYNMLKHALIIYALLTNMSVI